MVTRGKLARYDGKIIISSCTNMARCGDRKGLAQTGWNGLKQDETARNRKTDGQEAIGWDRKGIGYSRRELAGKRKEWTEEGGFIGKEMEWTVTRGRLAGRGKNGLGKKETER